MPMTTRSTRPRAPLSPTTNVGNTPASTTAGVITGENGKQKRAIARAQGRKKAVEAGKKDGGGRKGRTKNDEEDGGKENEDVALNEKTNVEEDPALAGEKNKDDETVNDTAPVTNNALEASSAHTNVELSRTLADKGSVETSQPEKELAQATLTSSAPIETMKPVIEHADSEISPSAPGFTKLTIEKPEQMRAATPELEISVDGNASASAPDSPLTPLPPTLSKLEISELSAFEKTAVDVEKNAASTENLSKDDSCLNALNEKKSYAAQALVEDSSKAAVDIINVEKPDAGTIGDTASPSVSDSVKSVDLENLPDAPTNENAPQASFSTPSKDGGDTSTPEIPLDKSKSSLKDAEVSLANPTEKEVEQPTLLPNADAEKSTTQSGKTDASGRSISTSATPVNDITDSSPVDDGQKNDNQQKPARKPASFAKKKKSTKAQEIPVEEGQKDGVEAVEKDKEVAAVDINEPRRTRARKAAANKSTVQRKTATGKKVEDVKETEKDPVEEASAGKTDGDGQSHTISKASTSTAATTKKNAPRTRSTPKSKPSPPPKETQKRATTAKKSTPASKERTTTTPKTTAAARRTTRASEANKTKASEQPKKFTSSKQPETKKSASKNTPTAQPEPPKKPTPPPKPAKIIGNAVPLEQFITTAPGTSTFFNNLKKKPAPPPQPYVPPPPPPVEDHKRILAFGKLSGVRRESEEKGKENTPEPEPKKGSRSKKSARASTAGGRSEDDSSGRRNSGRNSPADTDKHGSKRSLSPEPFARRPRKRHVASRKDLDATIISSNDEDEDNQLAKNRRSRNIQENLRAAGHKPADVLLNPRLNSMMKTIIITNENGESITKTVLKSARERTPPPPLPEVTKIVTAPLKRPAAELESRRRKRARENLYGSSDNHKTYTGYDRALEERAKEAEKNRQKASNADDNDKDNNSAGNQQSSSSSRTPSNSSTTQNETSSSLAGTKRSATESAASMPAAKRLQLTDAPTLLRPDEHAYDAPRAPTKDALEAQKKADETADAVRCYINPEVAVNKKGEQVGDTFYRTMGFLKRKGGLLGEPISNNDRTTSRQNGSTATASTPRNVRPGDKTYEVTTNGVVSKYTIESSAAKNSRLAGEHESRRREDRAGGFTRPPINPIFMGPNSMKAHLTSLREREEADNAAHRAAMKAGKPLLWKKLDRIERGEGERSVHAASGFTERLDRGIMGIGGVCREGFRGSGMGADALFWPARERLGRDYEKMEDFKSKQRERENGGF